MRVKQWRGRGGVEDGMDTFVVRIFVSDANVLMVVLELQIGNCSLQMAQVLGSF